MPTMKRIKKMNVLFSLLFPLWLLSPCMAADTNLAVRLGEEGPGGKGDIHLFRVREYNANHETHQ